eukprot:TRINITY_DN806_c0_g1_i2.p1 TRINITY_DN806_c0_g1~~TRINITY_DN806_c0_g1_i2.p1  ORF type:complete len:345 (+),score=79.60 TRINITY_DN806_c0_g1_i2:60-1094(+)
MNPKSVHLVFSLIVFFFSCILLFLHSFVMEDKPEGAPHACPGVGNVESGHASACATCPNRHLCRSGRASGPDPDLAIIKERLKDVSHVIVVVSGKGGVGKSTVSSQLAFYLSSQGHEVGLMDVDICGPSIPRMMGVSNMDVHSTMMGWEPVYVTESLGVMSIAFLLPEDAKDSAIIWRGPKKNGMIKSFLKDVTWGKLDYLIVDTPPGTSDEHLSVVTYLKQVGISGAVVVTTPQDVAISDVRREISFCRRVGIPVLGLVENMSGFICPHCSTRHDIFPSTHGGADELAKEMDTEVLGKIPLEQKLMTACEEGTPFFEACQGTETEEAIKLIVKGVMEKCPIKK